MNELLKRSVELDTILNKLFNLRLYNDAERIRASRIMCSVAFEHAESVKMLLATHNFTSAIGLIRLQYEAFVRALWLCYAASDLAVSNLMAELTHESSKKADKIPLLSEMLKQLDGKAPQVALDQLLEFKEYSWKPLSSYVHGGIHAISRHSKGYPLPLLFQSLKGSNGLSLNVGMLLVILSGDRNWSGRIPEIQLDFLDCLPDLKLHSL